MLATDNCETDIAGGTSAFESLTKTTLKPPLSPRGIRGYQKGEFNIRPRRCQSEPTIHRVSTMGTSLQNYIHDNYLHS